MSPKHISGSLFTVGATGKPVQFVREEVYAISPVGRHKNRKTGERNPPKSAGRAVIGELIREAPEYYRHLTAEGIRPIAPRLLWGKDPRDLVKWYEDLVRAAETIKVKTSYKGGSYERRQRSTASILLSAVASYPSPPDSNNRDYRKWCLRVVAWAKRHYGNRLVSVCEHLDEGYGHVHCLVAHPDAQSARSLHSGHSAADKAKAAGAPKREQNRAYRAALVCYQDEFFDRVGRRCGLDRVSLAPKRRLSYSDAKLKRKHDEERAAFDAEMASRRKIEAIRAQKTEQDQMERISAIQAREAEAENVRTQLDRDLARMDADRARFVLEKADFDTKTAALRREQSDLAKANAKFREDLDEVGRIEAAREDIYMMWAEAVREGAVSRDVAMQILQDREWPTGPLLSQLGRSAPRRP